MEVSENGQNKKITADDNLLRFDSGKSLKKGGDTMNTDQIRARFPEEAANRRE